MKLYNLLYPALFLAPALARAAQPTPPPPPVCAVIGEVFGTDAPARTILVKRDDNSALETIAFSAATRFVDPSLQPFDPMRVQTGDRLCVQFPSSPHETASTIYVLTRQVIQSQQAAVLAALHRNSAFGEVASTDQATQSFAIRRVRLDGAVRTVEVDAAAPALFRRYAPDAAVITDVSPSSFAAIRPGDQVYVRGQRSPDGASIRASLVILGGFHTVVGSIVTIDALHDCVDIEDTRSHRTLTIHAYPQALFRISPFLPDGVIRDPSAGQRPAWRLHALEFADLRPGDTVSALVRSGDPSSQRRALALGTGFGSFGLLPAQPDAQVLWFLDPLALDLP